jgi:pSer/pThr/pTyr-binding forkhead associated (FHA) protein
MAKLGLLVDGVIVKTFQLDKVRMTIGRDIECDIQIDDVGVSMKHAAIIVAPNKFLDGYEEILIEDLQSRNGTLVNDQVVNRCQLRPNDTITNGINRFKLLDATAQGRESTVLIVME